MTSALATSDYAQAHDELAREIRKRRQDCPPDETARQLLAYDQAGHTALVGIGTDARRAVLYHEHDRYVITVSFGPDGLTNGGPRIAGSNYWPGIDTWVELMDAYWGWLHPRFR